MQLHTLAMFLSVSVEIIGSAAMPIAGESYSLTCNVSGVSVTTYQWRKDGTVLAQNRQSLFFSSLRLSDAGHYTCNASVNSVMYSNGRNVTIKGKNAEKNIIERT